MRWTKKHHCWKQTQLLTAHDCCDTKKRWIGCHVEQKIKPMELNKKLTMRSSENLRRKHLTRMKCGRCSAWCCLKTGWKKVHEQKTEVNSSSSPPPPHIYDRTHWLSVSIRYLQLPIWIGKDILKHVVCFKSLRPENGVKGQCLGTIIHLYLDTDICSEIEAKWIQFCALHTSPACDQTLHECDWSIVLRP